mgnify:FL=1
MMQYKVVYGYEPTFQEAFQNLEREVEQLLQAGWEPQGNLSILTDENGYDDYYLVCQTMVK